MLDINYIQDNLSIVKKAIQDKQLVVDLDLLLKLDDQRRKLIVETEAIRSRRNQIAQELKTDRDDKLISEGKKLKDQSLELENELKDVREEWLKLMRQVPNIPMTDVPIGQSEADNKVIRKEGKAPRFKFAVKDHIALGTDLDIIDMPRAAKVSGARFGYWKGGAAMLELALIQYVTKILTSEDILKGIAKKVGKNVSIKPFIPVFPPIMIKPEVYRRTTRLSNLDQDEKFYIEKDNLYLIGSAEHTLVPLYMDETLGIEKMPLRYFALSTSFRREAGSYGKDTRGMIRVHQFDKIEMESFSSKDQGLNEHLFQIAIQEYIMSNLEIPYQLVFNSTGDMGVPDARQNDIESWMPGQGRYRETHTADYMTDYQARSLNIRVRQKDGTTEFVHTSDATAITMRAVIAILENNQQQDGSVKVPKVLQEYTGFKEIPKP
jgi:seryl-tRNA synthetase